MSALSPLQNLPLFVVEMIVGHVVDNIRQSVSGPGDIDMRRKSLHSLMTVCHSFRAIAYPRYYRNCMIAFSGALVRCYSTFDTRTNARCYVRIRDKCLGYPTSNLVKDLEIELDEWVIYAGEVNQKLLPGTDDGHVLTSVSKLTLLFSSDECNRWDGDGDSNEFQAIDPNEAEENISAFVQWIRRMTPLVKEIIIGRDSDDAGSMAANGYFSALISRLYQFVDRVELENESRHRIYTGVQFDDICHLTHINYLGNDLNSQFTRLARQNASILQSLVIVSEDERIDACALVTNDDGSSVVFPSLLKLKLGILSDAEVSRQPPHSGPVLFPCLRSLTLDACSEFDMRVFFRGNAATLESLDIILDTRMVAAIRRYNVFTPISHPGLKCVKVSFSDNFTPGIFATAAEAMQFTLNIGPSAPVREIREPSPGDKLLPVYSLLGNHTCIQVLSLEKVRPDLWDVISLIKSLPPLSDLHTSSARLGAIPADMRKLDLLAYICANYALMGKRFRCWHFHGPVPGSEFTVATCVLLLALACPAFDYALPHPGSQCLFRGPLQQTIQSDMFKDHEPRLRRFL